MIFDKRSSQPFNHACVMLRRKQKLYYTASVAVCREGILNSFELGSGGINFIKKPMRVRLPGGSVLDSGSFGYQR